MSYRSRRLHIVATLKFLPLNRFSGKIIEFTVLVLGVLLCQLYGSALTSHKITETEIIPFETFSELASNLDYTPISTQYAATKNVLMNRKTFLIQSIRRIATGTESKDKVMLKLGGKLHIKSRKNPATNFADISEKLINSPSVFISTSTDFSKFNYMDDVTSMQSLDGIEMPHYIAFPKSSPISRIFNIFLQDATESGIMNRIKSSKKYSKQLFHQKENLKPIEPIEIGIMKALYLTKTSGSNIHLTLRRTRKIESVQIAVGRKVVKSEFRYDDLVLTAKIMAINNRQIEENVSWLILTCDLGLTDFDEDFKPTPNTRIILAKLPSNYSKSLYLKRNSLGLSILSHMGMT
ncbi:hypothetical protein GQR58_014773 [Nymphon striatum]|nr:hypothetical protein GQR58_014773 [Nymphon striatum]